MVSESCGEDRAPIVPSENLGKKRALLGLPEVSGKKFWIFWIFLKCGEEIAFLGLYSSLPSGFTSHISGYPGIEECKTYIPDTI